MCVRMVSVHTHTHTLKERKQTNKTGNLHIEDLVFKRLKRLNNNNISMPCRRPIGYGIYNTSLLIPFFPLFLFLSISLFPFFLFIIRLYMYLLFLISSSVFFLLLLFASTSLNSGTPCCCAAEKREEARKNRIDENIVKIGRKMRER